MNPRLLAPVLGCLALCARGWASQDVAQRSQPWPARVIELAESLPVQDGGRVKPLSTFAGFTLLRLNGKRSLMAPDGEKLAPVEWLLDVLFFPETAALYPVFLVQNAEVIQAIGVADGGKKKRDRYAFEELRAGLPRLFELAHEYGVIEAEERSAFQSQVVALAENVLAFVRLTRHELIALIPPDAPVEQEAEWLTPAELVSRADQGRIALAHAEVLQGFEALLQDGGDLAAFECDLAGLHGHLVRLAGSRGEYAKIGLEVGYTKARLLAWSLALFVLAFFAAAFLWLRPKSRFLYAAVSASVLGATLVLCAAIVLRCWIRGRPPVSTLYETVLFVTAVGAGVALFVESINRQRIAVSAAACLGMVGLFIANGYETLDKQDTMPSLVAVLDTNFWLATHVTAITTGYSAGMLAALLASIYLLSKAAGWKRGEPAFYRTLGRMVYGVLCFGTVFATVGTILGGIWANESWGRFWGWDPKENGALLIVISQVAILHARMGGYLREHGVCMAGAFGGTVIAFSWWGVNLLGVGLHSYGFTSGVHTALWTYYGIQWGVVALGGVAWFRERARAAAEVRARTALSAAGKLAA